MFTAFILVAHYWTQREKFIHGEFIFLTTSIAILSSSTALLWVLSDIFSMNAIFYSTCLILSRHFLLALPTSTSCTLSSAFFCIFRFLFSGHCLFGSNAALFLWWLYSMLSKILTITNMISYILLSIYFPETLTSYDAYCLLKKILAFENRLREMGVISGEDCELVWSFIVCCMVGWIWVGGNELGDFGICFDLL